MEDLKKLKVPELKELLGQHNLSQAGKKDELVARLMEAGILAPPASLAGDDLDDLSLLAPPTDGQISDDAHLAAIEAWDAEIAGGVPDMTLPESVPEPAPVAEVSPSTAASASQPATSTVAVTAAESAEDEVTRRKKRAQRFGIELSDDLKKADRAKRFGLSASDATGKEGQRQSGKPGAIKPATTVGDEEAKKRRLERFGATGQSSTAQQKSKIAPAATTVDAEEAERRRRRAERFGAASTATEDAANKKLKTSV